MAATSVEDFAAASPALSTAADLSMVGVVDIMAAAVFTIDQPITKFQNGICR